MYGIDEHLLSLCEMHTPTLPLYDMVKLPVMLYDIVDMGGSPGDVSEEPVKSSANSPNFPSLHLRHSSFSNPSVALPTSQLILQPFRCFTYITVHSPTLLSLYLRHSSFSNPSVASPTSQFILQPLFRFFYVTSSSFNSPGEPSMTWLGKLFVLAHNRCVIIGLQVERRVVGSAPCATSLDSDPWRTSSRVDWLGKDR